MKVFLLYPKYYDFTNEKLHIGGVETYITNLLNVLQKMGLTAVVVQAGGERTLRINDQVEIRSRETGPNYSKKLLSYAEELGDTERDLLLFIHNEAIYPTKFQKAIAIQHGIGFDTPWIAGHQAPEWIAAVYRFIQAQGRLRKLKYVNKLVCVDYNYINWARTQNLDRSLNYSVIPNFTQVPSTRRERRRRDQVRIVFARRLSIVRGSHLIIGVFRKALERYSNISITIAGTGSCLNELKDAFRGESRVDFTAYDSCDSVQFHSQYDIAMVPSIASEGTSLSLLEAMAAECAVLATDVGGMTNIILDGYNGLLCKPEEADCFEKLSSLIEDADLRARLADHAYETVAGAFGLERWEAAWKEVFEEFLPEASRKAVP